MSVTAAGLVVFGYNLGDNRHDKCQDNVWKLQLYRETYLQFYGRYVKINAFFDEVKG